MVLNVDVIGYLGREIDAAAHPYTVGIVECSGARSSYRARTETSVIVKGNCL